jgi:hypothetical protein
MMSLFDAIDDAAYCTNFRMSKTEFVDKIFKLFETKQLSSHEAQLFYDAGMAAVIAMREQVNNYINGKR